MSCCTFSHLPVSIGEMMNIAPREIEIETDAPGLIVAGRESVPAVFAGILNADTTLQMHRMFRDPRVLEPVERAELVAQLRNAVDLNPGVAELRVLLGMALCVDLQAQQAMEELRIAVELAPDSFVARLKYGELLMHLRICQRAAEETHKAAQLAVNAAQSEMARRQAATIRTMLREGVERGGYAGVLSKMFRLNRRSKEQTNLPVYVGTK
jgi:cytochrome c-type biogenesis protein CcmH/NrfG